MHRIDGEGATVDNRFSEGNPATGAIATAVTADWANAVQEEIVAVITAAGIPLAKADNAQLLAAILSLIAGGGAAVAAAGVSVEDAGGYFAGIEVESALQQLATKLYAGTINANQIIRSVLTLNGAAFQTEAAHVENILELSNATAITYTVRLASVYDAPIGAAITLSQAGAGKVSVVGAVGVTIKKPVGFNAATLGQDATIVLYKVSANTWRLGGMLEAA